MRTLQRRLRRQPRQFAHEADERNRGHVGDECVIFRHVANDTANLFYLGADIVAENGGGAAGGLIETEEGINESGLPGAVRAEKSDGSSGEGTRQAFEDFPLAETYRQSFEFNYRGHLIACDPSLFCTSMAFPRICGTARVSRFNPRKVPVEDTRIRL